MRFHGWFQGLRFAYRGLVRAPAFTGVVVLTLGIGVGITTAVFAVVDALLVAPLPYPHPEQLLLIWSDLRQSGYPRAPLSGPEVQDFRDRSRLIRSVAAVFAASATMTGDGDPEQLRVGLVTSNFFEVLGANASPGRTFLATEEGPGTAQTIVLNWDLWQRRFAGDPAIVGRHIQINDRPTLVVGVMPRDFTLVMPPDMSVSDGIQAWAPMPTKLAGGSRAAYYLFVIGRLAPGATLASAKQEIERIGSQIASEHTEYAGTGRQFYAAGLHEDTTGEARPAVLAVFAGAGIVLLIACVNVAGLLIARAMARSQETAVRAALGASRWRLVRDRVAEGLLIGCSAAVVGIVTSRWMLAIFTSITPPGLKRIETSQINPHGLGFGLLLAIGWGVLVSLAPTVGFREELRAPLQRVVRSAASPSHPRLRTALVVAQIPLGVILLVSAGLLTRALYQLNRTDLGFRPANILTFRVSLPPRRYRTLADVSRFSRALEAQLHQLPGVTDVATVSHIPYDTGNWSTPYRSEQSAEGEIREADARAVSPAFFATIGARMIAGRAFDESDDDQGPRAIVVDESLADRTWPGQVAVGKRLRVDFIANGQFEPTWATVVGVVHRIRHRTPSADVREQVYEPIRQSRRDPLVYLIRSNSPDVGALAAPIRQRVAALDKDLSVYELRPLDAFVARATSARRFTTALVITFAAVALILACIGVNGLVAYSVALRRQEFGVRFALGARPGQVIRQILQECVRFTAVGLTLGLVGALVAARLLQTQWLAVSPRDPVAYGTAIVALVLCSLVACWLPVRQAARVNPSETLRGS